MNNPTPTPKYNPEQAARCVDAALRWIEERRDKKDTDYTASVLVSFLQEAKASLFPAQIAGQAERG